MTSAAEIQIFVSTRPHLSPADEDLARALVAKGYADLYTLRQRLQGMFPTRLAHGSAASMEPLLEVLRQHGHPHRVMPRRISSIPPESIEDLRLQANQVELRSQTQTILCHPGTTLLAIVADASGRLKERQLKRFLVRNTFGASATDTDIANIDDLEQEIFHLSPVLDIYRLDATGAIEVGIRILPGKFDHRRLGDAAGLSRHKNLETLWHKIKEANPDMQVHYSFGLAFPPEYSPETVAEKDAYSTRDNFEALTRYAWLVAELERDAEFTPEPGAEQSSAIKTIPGLFAALPFPLGTQGVAPMINSPSSVAGQANTDTSNMPNTDALPQPPAPEVISGLKLYRNSLRMLLGTGIALAFGLGQTLILFGTNTLAYLYSSGIAQGFLGLLSIGIALRYFLLKRHIDNTPTSKIRSLAMGMVEIHGRAERTHALVSPVSGLPCVYYRIKRYKRRHVRGSSMRHTLSGSGDNQWSLVSITSSSTVPFMVRDETGAIEIDPARADIKIRTTHAGTGAMSRLPFSVNEGKNANMRWVEELIPAGSPIYILGFARTQITTPTQTEMLRQALKDLKQDHAQLQQYDLNGDGHIDSNEWELARQATETQLLIDQLNQDQESNTRSYISRPPTGNYPFLIAETESELHLTRKLKYSTGLFLAAGLSLCIWGLYMAC
ncbi:MAG: GIDE domain-containing protein [Desulfuromonadaceae bacterium]|nr:GIDE domain-containing protein [Desulfuromonas sp.]MDY0184809.1 GIDE domain-containing protein [Desulfuromonadaceae bacterium]